MIAHLQTHRDTRINADDGMPDTCPDTHAFVFNLTHDPVEDKLKAAAIGQTKHDAPFYEAVYAKPSDYLMPKALGDALGAMIADGRDLPDDPQARSGERRG